jgi:hypothetical protein
MRLPTSFTAARKLALPLASMVVSDTAILNLSSDAGPTAPLQAAAPSCTLTVPSKIAISSPSTQPAVALGAYCAAAGVIDARWDAKRADGVLMHQYVSRWNRPGVPWNVFDTESLAPRTWQPAGATTGTDPTVATRQPTLSPSAGKPSKSQSTEATSIPQNAPVTDVRMGSKTELTASYSGLTWTTTGTVTRYAITPHGFIPYGGVVGSIQRKRYDATGWSVVKNVTADGAGKVSMTGEWDGYPSYWRIVFYDAQYIFGNISREHYF